MVDAETSEVSDGETTGGLNDESGGAPAVTVASWELGVGSAVENLANVWAT